MNTPECAARKPGPAGAVRCGLKCWSTNDVKTRPVEPPRVAWHLSRMSSVGRLDRAQSVGRGFFDWQADTGVSFGRKQVTSTSFTVEAFREVGRAIGLCRDRRRLGK